MFYWEQTILQTTKSFASYTAKKSFKITSNLIPGDSYTELHTQPKTVHLEVTVAILL